jgi:hypothetical protein
VSSQRSSTVVLREVKTSSPDDLRKATDLAKIARFLQRLQDGAFYGTLSIGFQGGKLSALEVKQTIKPDEL